MRMINKNVWKEPKNEIEGTQILHICFIVSVFSVNFYPNALIRGHFEKNKEISQL